ncbi:MAG: hypothetical protein ABIH36_00395 [bacterium]
MQGILWWSVDFVDESFWLKKIDFLKEDIFSASLAFNAKRHAAHPGTLILLPAAMMSRVGLTTADSLRLAVTLINAVAITAMVTMARQLRPGSPWWFGAAGTVRKNIKPRFCWQFYLELWQQPVYT